ncbi:hypothetical protein SAMN05444422_11050 [Halobiforma haloterrestris]|uniref:Uncharacterized protein n=1 Tax=Natronobacterium haloterrestre TaxID=148448 RepID=A0A1I1K1U7_NATHA|nr:hypothetical protein [Halobiforma haloterrestris]SFC54716.1 hypothetical protein SAMN05444422_11050 [Halobiforma haloterrestris]
MVSDTLVGVLGFAVVVGLFVWAYRDATRVDVSRPLLWAVAVAGAFAVGVCLYLFTDAPMTGVIMTSNTGLVLYGFEREVTVEDDDPAEPGQLP